MKFSTGKTCRFIFAGIFTVLLFLFSAGCGAGRGAGADSSANSSQSGEYQLKIAWPESGSSRIIPSGSVYIDVSIEGDNLSSPITGRIESPASVLSITNIPVGYKVATIKALDVSGNVTSQRKESFRIIDCQTAVSEKIPLGVAITGDSQSPRFEPSGITVPPGKVLYFQNWTEGDFTCRVNSGSSENDLNLPGYYRDSDGKWIYPEGNAEITSASTFAITEKPSVTGALSIAIPEYDFVTKWSVETSKSKKEIQQEPQYASGEFFVKFRQEAVKSDSIRKGVTGLGERSGISLSLKRKYDIPGVALVKGSPGENAEAMVEIAKRDPSIEYAEPNYKCVLDSPVIPNDAYFSKQYALNNNGGLIYVLTSPFTAIADSDLDAPEAWELTTGDQNVIVGVIDTGANYNHEDLHENIWHNTDEDWVSGEPGHDGIDNDGDGYIDNYYGINPIYDKTDSRAGDPMDDYWHGTHVSGIIGAVGNNGIGTSGVCMRVSVMPLRFYGVAGGGTMAQVLECMEFARSQGVKILSASWGLNAKSEILKDEINSLGESGILFVTASGNGGSDSIGDDLDGAAAVSPAADDCPNILTVASSDYCDNLSFFSNYGRFSIDVAAPGEYIYSTMPSGYQTRSGTSMACPCVAGAAALIKSYRPDLNCCQIKARIIRGVDKRADFKGVTVSGGRVSIYNAMTDSGGPCIFGFNPVDASSGTVLTITGSDFGSNQGTVLFGRNTNTVAVQSWSDTEIKCLIPEGGSDGDVTVIDSLGNRSNVLNKNSEVYSPDIDVDSSSNIYMADPEENYIKKFTSIGDVVTKWSKSGSISFKRPQGIALDSSGNIYISDTRSNTIFKCRPDFTLVARWFDYLGLPTGIAIDNLGKIMVADTWNCRVNKYDVRCELSGTVWSNNVYGLGKLGAKGTGDSQFDNPGGVAVDSSGNVFIADSLNNCIKVFDSTGGFLSKWGSSGSGDALLDSPSRVRVDQYGYIFVADEYNHCIKRFDSAGNFLTKFGSEGYGDSEFKNPCGIGLDVQGNVYVIDKLSHVIRKFAPVW